MKKDKSKKSPREIARIVKELKKLEMKPRAREYVFKLPLHELDDRPCVREKNDD